MKIQFSKNINAMLYSSFTTMLDSVQQISNYYKVDTKNAKVLFVPFADEENKYYLALCKQALLLSGIEKKNINTLTSHKHKQGQFDIIFVSGGNVCRLKDKLCQIDWFDEIKARIDSGVLYIGDSAGAVLFGKTIEHTLDYEPYDNELNNYNGLNIIDKAIVVHFSKKRFSGSLKKAINVTDCYSAHVAQTKFLGKKNFITIKNNQAICLKNGTIKNIFFSFSKIKKSVLAESSKYHKKDSK